jgi:hypothetical protein
MTALTLLAVLSVAFLLAAWAVEWATERLREPARYADTSRGTRRD